ncbi:MalY/PatB family protein [Saccharospirillum salsuginis]|uniref:cysteine-S-conjugate beta-lyase n=1 Tax=Saccharospirillum salsuginis TaxID=418750 RepID=A0A918KIN0_9GAMM|nr:PatB family C-S lyase [Saccharospirillum salsuginis]GGX64838.1 aspartate aminotransferase [Saccharospirillum salsuginis]
MFDAIDRQNTHAIKIDRYRDQDVIPLWVADMDLATAPVVQQALNNRMAHPVYGYTHPWPELNRAVVDWCAREYDWAIEPDWIVWLPGVVPSFNLAIQAFASGGRVIVQEPNYPPLRHAPAHRGAVPVRLPVVFDGERWIWDWAHLESELADPNCHLMILCNPMNPHGTVLTADDLERLGALCEQHEVVLCSDEIHCDLRLDPECQHVPAGRVPTLSANSLTLMAASKTFNVAGLGCSFAIIPDADLRLRFQAVGRDLVPHPNFLGYCAAEAAFRDGKDWLVALRGHLRANREHVAQVFNSLPGLRYRPQPATFLAWIESDLEVGAAMRHFVKAGLMPSDGKEFGDPTAVRLNFGTDRSTLERALTQLEAYWRQKMPSSS